MLTADQVKTISNIRQNPKEILNQLAAGKGPFYLLYRSQLKGVMLDLKTYARFQEIAEEYQDSLEAQKLEKIDKKKISWVSHEEVKTLLK